MAQLKVGAKGVARIAAKLGVKVPPNTPGTIEFDLTPEKETAQGPNGTTIPRRNPGIAFGRGNFTVPATMNVGNAALSVSVKCTVKPNPQDGGSAASGESDE